MAAPVPAAVVQVMVLQRQLHVEHLEQPRQRRRRRQRQPQARVALDLGEDDEQVACTPRIRKSPSRAP